MIDRIGNCLVVGEIGSGGMAVVYRAVQESLGRTVAIKALRASAAGDPSFLVRFEREARSVAALQHENIIQVYDFHQHQGEAYIVMELVEGIDLFDLLEKAPVLPVDVAAIIAVQLGRALDYAHYRGIIHRDIKPANVMIARSGGVKLMDFGIARDESFDDLTKDGTGLGTPSYMSPEQVLGDKLDFRSDMFSLGIVLYQMVCGCKPFIEDEHRSVMHKIRVDKLVPPRRLNPQIPRELERIIQRCLEKQREDRFRSTQDLVIALERFLVDRCDMNYRARLVLFLQEAGIIAEEEADRQLHPSVVGGTGPAATRTPLLPRLVLVEAAILGAMALVVSWVHLSSLGGSQKAMAAGVARAADKPPGYVRVIVEPWADVYVDGKMLDTTPLVRLELPEGRHHLELKNPDHPTEARDIQVKRGATQIVKVTLKP